MRLPLIALPSLLCANLFAGDFSRTSVGTTGSEFLLLNTSARGIAMGGAMTAITDDAASIYWNPAGLSHVPRVSATFLHAQYVADISYDAGAVASRLNDAAVIAGGMRYLDGGSIDRTDINGVGNGTFHPRAYVGEVGWGGAIFDLSDSEMDMTMGATARAIQSNLGTKSAAAYGADFGFQTRYYTSNLDYDIGFVAQNVGRGQKFDQTRDTLPTRIRVGAAVRPVKPLTLSAEVAAPINDAPFVAAGVEWNFEVQRDLNAFARAGFSSQTLDALGVASTLSLGTGIKLSQFSFDYAFVPMGVLGSATHRVSVSFNLPAKVSQRYRER